MLLLAFVQANRDIMDDDMREMLRNNPPDVVFTAFSTAFFKGAIRMFQKDTDLKNIILTDTQADAPRRHHGRGHPATTLLQGSP